MRSNRGIAEAAFPSNKLTILATKYTQLDFNFYALESLLYFTKNERVVILKYKKANKHFDIFLV